MAPRRTLLALLDDMAVEIAGLVAVSSPHLMEDLCSLRATYMSTVHPRTSRITTNLICLPVLCVLQY
jgi:hypothetical protein